MKKTAYQKACKLLKQSPATIDNFSHESEEDRKMCYGEHKFRICIKAANLDEDGKPHNFDWLNWNEQKWRIWMKASKQPKRPSGVGFSFDDSGSDDSGSVLGSCLHFKTDAIALKLAKDPEIIEYFNEWMGV